MLIKKALLAAAAASLMTFSAYAQAPVKIGMITTLSGPGGYLGADIRDAFKLAVDMEGGKLGGVPVEVVVEDDGLKPGQGKQIAEKFMKNDGIKLITGIVFSNVSGATVPDILDNGGFYLSPNAGPSNFAGKECHKNYFVVSWANDSLHESAGEYATSLGFKSAFILAPNYQAGKDALTGFKRYFKGTIAGEVYTRLDQTDFSAEMAQIRAAKPEVVFQFHPGGLGITFMRQFQQAGLLGTVPMVVAEASLDSTIMKALGEAAIGVNVTAHWNADFDNPANKEFVAAFTKAYNRVPTYYASQSYDTARVIASALKATKGDINNADAFRAALKKADFASVRGGFSFGANQHPVQDWYALKVVAGAGGAPELKTEKKIITARGDFYADQCKM